MQFKLKLSFLGCQHAQSIDKPINITASLLLNLFLYGVCSATLQKLLRYNLTTF